jgi:hypothetical protein
MGFTVDFTSGSAGNLGEAYGLSPNKKLGQNFLVDENYITK